MQTKIIKSDNDKVEDSDLFDVAVIGGGPAGMMSAGRSAELGAKVILLEKNPSLGVKLLITGGGRCNVTNANFDLRDFLKKYGESDKFLFSTFSQFNVEDTIKFFNERGMPTKVEAENRVFPTSDRAQSVWQVLIDYMKQSGVKIETDTQVLDFENDGNNITGVLVSKNGKKKIIKAKKYILATGGVSRPETGSTGDGFNWLKKLGHNIIEPSNALVPVAIKESWVKDLQGIALSNIKLSVYEDDKKRLIKKGKMLFTHFGISGPAVLNLSKEIGEIIKYANAIVSIDLLPNLDHGMMNNKLQELFQQDNKKKIKNSLGTIIPPALVRTVLWLALIDEDKENNSIKREERLKLIETIKNMRMTVAGLLGDDKAIVSSGGADLREIDFRTMQSKIIPNLYLIGDVLNIDRPSGGYSLQLCWTTGFVAGNWKK